METVKNVLLPFVGGVAIGVCFIALDKRYHSTRMQTFVVSRALLRQDGYCPRWQLLLRNCAYIETSTNLTAVRLIDHHAPFPIKSGTTITFIKPERALFYYWWGTING